MVFSPTEAGAPSTQHHSKTCKNATLIHAQAPSSSSQPANYTGIILTTILRIHKSPPPIRLPLRITTNASPGMQPPAINLTYTCTLPSHQHPRHAPSALDGPSRKPKSLEPNSPGDAKKINFFFHNMSRHCIVSPARADRHQAAKPPKGNDKPDQHARIPTPSAPFALTPRGETRKKHKVRGLDTYPAAKES